MTPKTTKAPGSTAEEVAAAAREVERLEDEERQRSSRPGPIAAAKIKLLELQRRQVEWEIEPLEVERAEAHERLEAAEAKYHEAIEERGRARSEWSRVHGLTQSREERIRRIDQEIRELKGEER
jgi:hypothetical protein